MERPSYEAEQRLPTPIKTSSRICFGIKFFATEEEASVYSDYVRATGQTYNGGYFDGMPCGRDSGFDFTDAAGVRHFAVTTA